ncbi:3-hydroxy-5-phosphonooxypentane-2,4-dione thiolase [Cloacibacillus porcorum]|uniref:Autoinducer 2 aldolase n=1 Tax=Cloacibacillus porcorum TaxID=1197717 RepID=A0A1B2I761_9BACT|nr:3-hydroxy-5-phosphonooxypentane-2,4-dione thiolase [Cloacibacillus porcorum]ANZ45810.1 autoinducer 2 aldolase [Cloacibacillus porcorum]MCD7876075.1 3-hydroxy-5-phosphonooxypentane-2,4-dione thiolase [Cloacibacillus porcorum]MCD8392738.1 3-hydroxy-5-phosphonooxypentane-2,4-dione thiolase [Cloacibacillus porcorum]MCI5864177.1 3-hydroxy-5-phosphonooxypentane-2,4-dione thiolase [Cloacibacillus porcorum]MDD7650608.1 3-hydroxy-5-phosphonooxypentane-2,4-dione thiolase [Cloacibacillus porcorum]
MVDKIGNILAKDYGLDRPVEQKSFYVKGAEHCDWGMKDRLARIFDPKSGRTVMLAFDHGYIMGPTAGLERLDLAIPPLAPYADVLMATRGAIKSCVPPTFNKAIALRCTTDTSVLHEDLSYGHVGVDVEDAIRLNASCIVVQTFVGSKNEVGSFKNLSDMINAGNRYGIPVMGVTAVGKEMERTKRYFQLATRILAELGAQVIKTYYCEGFEEVTAACPVPIVIAGGKKTPEKEALEMAYNAIRDGAAGVDMGRNIFQSENPAAMLQAVRAVVHENASAKEAYDLFLSLK